MLFSDRSREIRAIAAAMMFVIALGGIKLPIAIQTRVSAHAPISAGDTQTTIPVGKYVALLEIPYPPPTPVPVNDGSYDILFYNVGWNLNGSVVGGPINIYVLNDSNYQDFNSSRQYSAFQQLLNVSGSFKLHIVLPANGPGGTYVFDDNNASYGWWIVFDNGAGLSNATLSLFIESTGSYRFIFHQIGIDEPVLLLAAGVIAAALFLVGAGIWKHKRGADSKPQARSVEYAGILCHPTSSFSPAALNQNSRLVLTYLKHIVLPSLGLWRLGWFASTFKISFLSS